MSRTPRPARLAVTLVGMLAVLSTAAGCSSGSSSATGTTTPSASAVASTTAPPAPAPPPRVGSCHRLTFAEATSPTDDSSPVGCGTTHTSTTIAVGTLHLIADGHLLAVDSRAAQDQLARRCPARLPAYVGGDLTTRRLSRLEVVWFGPSVEQADLGARWFRCDLVALGDQGRLAPLAPKMRGVLDHAGALDRWGTCGTAAPTARGFRRVICSAPHTWQAVDIITLPPGTRFLGKAATADANARCKDVAKSRAGGALKYTWSFEWPTRQQWRAGQHYGYCWIPTA
jgi:hypothetical protein